MKKCFLMIAFAMLLTACSTQTVIVNDHTGYLQKEEMQTFFINGLFQTQTMDAAAVCGGSSKVMKVERTDSFLNGVVRFLTQGLYTPYDAKVYCS
jgi:hypothetical protein